MTRDDSDAWVAALQGDSTDERDEAVARLHRLLLGAARFELTRRNHDAELHELATRAADNAMLAILDDLDDFPRRSRFTTWASKYALLEAAVAARRSEWAGRDITAAYEDWPSDARADDRFLGTVRDASWALTPQQRGVYNALALHGVPIDVLAERRGTTRGALYETLRQARNRLRAVLAGRELSATAERGQATVI